MPFLFLLLIAGCLTSENPFYEESDVIQDSRFVGTFQNLKQASDLAVTVVASKNGKYVVHVTESMKTTDYLATLFKIKESTFVDLIPLDEPKVIDKYQEGVATASGFLEATSHDGDGEHLLSSKRLHVVFRLSLLDKGIVCFFSKQSDDPSDPLTHSGLKLRGENPVIEEPTLVLRSFIAKYAGTNWPALFDNPDVNSDNYFVLTRVQKGAVPSHLVGVWSAGKVEFKDGEISTGVALCINAYGVAGIVEQPESSAWHDEIGKKLEAIYNSGNHVLTLTEQPGATLGITNSIIDTFTYDPHAKTLAPKNAVIKGVLKRQESSVPYGVIENLD